MGRAAVAAAILVACMVSCRREPAAPPDKNRLVLELGGQSERLADTLAALHVGETRPVMPPKPDPGPGPDPDPTPGPQKVRQVRLEQGETIYAVAKRELGDSKRWKEILKLNGWSEEQASKLKTGSVVKIPER